MVRARFIAWSRIGIGLLTATTGRLAHAEPPAELARWLAPQEWVKDADAPIVALGEPGAFDDMHIFAPTVAHEGDAFLLWYCGSRGTRQNRVFRLGLATGTDGIHFEKSPHNPVLAFDDGERSVLTPSLLHDGDGNALREDGKLRMWFSSTAFGKTTLHTLHETISSDGIHWEKPSAAQLDNCYCPTVLKNTGPKGDDGYQLWYIDVSRRPWTIRYGTSADGRAWSVREKPVLELSQPWEAEIVVYPCVLKIDGAYLMWYGSYNHAVRRQTTAIGFAASVDGIHWHKHSSNPVLLPDPSRAWEANYVTSGSVLRLADGSFRYWYASRKAPPFENLYFAINTARWLGPSARGAETQARLPLPPSKGDEGMLGSVEVLEVVDEDDAIVRAYYAKDGDGEGTFVDLWVHGQPTAAFKAATTVELSGVYRAAGMQSFSTTCGGRSLPLLEPVRAD